MKLNSDLFWELCKEYEIPLSQDYSDIMIEDDDGSIRVFRDEDIDRIFASGDRELSSCDSEYKGSFFCWGILQKRQIKYI